MHNDRHERRVFFSYTLALRSSSRYQVALWLLHSLGGRCCLQPHYIEGRSEDAKIHVNSRCTDNQQLLMLMFWTKPSPVCRRHCKCRISSFLTMSTKFIFTRFHATLIATFLAYAEVAIGCTRIRSLVLHRSYMSLRGVLYKAIFRQRAALQTHSTFDNVGKPDNCNSLQSTRQYLCGNNASHNCCILTKGTWYGRSIHSEGH